MDPHLLTGLVAAVGRGRDPAALDEACRACAVALDVDGVAVTLAGRGDLRTVIAASDPDARHLEHAQLSAGEGPCTDATRTNSRVSTADLTAPAETRWPALVHRLGPSPIRAVTALPLTVGNATIGSLDVHSTRPHGLDGLDSVGLHLIAQTVTVTALAIRISDNTDVSAYLGDTADIHQATGMLAATLALPLDTALDLLRAHAFLHDRQLHDIAREVVTGLLSPAELRDTDLAALITTDPGAR